MLFIDFFYSVITAFGATKEIVHLFSIKSNSKCIFFLIIHFPGITYRLLINVISMMSIIFVIDARHAPLTVAEIILHRNNKNQHPLKNKSKMKKVPLNLLLLSATLFSVNVSAQKDSSGIFKTAKDFQQGKLIYAINYKTEKHKINDYVFFNDAVIKVKHHDSTYKLQKSETYGYRSTKGEDFRFVGDETYKILNSGEALLIYVFQHPAHSPKEAGKYLPMYFFSTDAIAAPQRLTKANLKAAFPDNHKFHDAIDENFKTDEELISYDSFHKMYKVNHILQMSPM